MTKSVPENNNRSSTVIANRESQPVLSRRRVLLALFCGSAMLLGPDVQTQEAWGQDFVRLLPVHIRQKLGKINPGINCFTSALAFHRPNLQSGVMANHEFAETLKRAYRELTKSEKAEMGDLLTVENPTEHSDNFHHAAIVLDEDHILDKPDADATALRIADLETLNKEWGRFWPADHEGHRMLLRYWRYNGAK